MTAEERKERKKERRIKKALRSYRCRFLKNFLIWLTGVFSSVIVFGLALVIGLNFVSVSTLTGDKTDEYVSSELANQSVLELIMNIDKYTVDDLPVVLSLLEDLQDSEISDGKKLSDFVQIDFDLLKSVKLTELSGALSSAIKVTASIENTFGVDLLGDFGQLETFNSFKEVEEVVDPTAENFNAKMYYYDNDGEFERAFNDDNSYVLGVDQTTTLYYAALTKVPITDALGLIGETFGRIEVVELLDLTGNASDEDENLIVKIFGERTINDLGEITDLSDLLDDETLEELYEDSDVLSKVKLGTILDGDALTNPILKKLVEDDVAVEDIGEAIDNMKLYETYGESVFKVKDSSAPADALWFKLESNGKTYTMVSSKSSATHYLSGDAGIWLLICFNSSETLDENGRPTSYTVDNSKTIASLNNGTSLTDSINNATIRQLVDVGIIEESETNSKIMKLKLVEVLKDPVGSVSKG